MGRFHSFFLNIFYTTFLLALFLRTIDLVWLCYRRESYLWVESLTLGVGTLIIGFAFWILYRASNNQKPWMTQASQGCDLNLAFRRKKRSSYLRLTYILLSSFVLFSFSCFFGVEAIIHGSKTIGYFMEQTGEPKAAATLFSINPKRYLGYCGHSTADSRFPVTVMALSASGFGCSFFSGLTWLWLAQKKKRTIRKTKSIFWGWRKLVFQGLKQRSLGNNRCLRSWLNPREGSLQFSPAQIWNRNAITHVAVWIAKQESVRLVCAAAMYWTFSI